MPVKPRRYAQRRRIASGAVVALCAAGAHGAPPCSAPRPRCWGVASSPRLLCRRALGAIPPKFSGGVAPAPLARLPSGCRLGGSRRTRLIAGVAPGGFCAPASLPVGAPRCGGYAPAFFVGGLRPPPRLRRVSPGACISDRSALRITARVLPVRGAGSAGARRRLPTPRPAHTAPSAAPP